MTQNIYNCKKYAVLYRLLCSIEKKSETNQRKLASDLGLSLGKNNYLLNELVLKGWIEASETISNRYGACLDKLTPTGLVERVAVTSRYLQSLIKQKQSIGTEIHVEA